MKIVMKTIYGSRLYGTFDENSDTDYKAVFIPTPEEIILGCKEAFNTNTNDSGKNSSDDIDMEYFTLKKFVNLLASGDNNAIDMLHSTGESLLETSPEFKYLYDNRKDFYTANMAGMIGFCKSHYHKFSRKADKFDELNLVKSVIKPLDFKSKVRDHLDKLPIGDFVFLTDPNEDVNGMQYYSVLGARHMVSITIGELFDSVERNLNSYGTRTRSIATLGAEWKSLYHTIRVMYETIEIYETNDLVFPSKHVDYLRDIKQGKLDRHDVERHMETLMKKVNELSAQNIYPKSIDKEKWNKFIVDIYSKQFNK